MSRRRRWQHSVDYRPFRGNKLKRKPGIEAAKGEDVKRKQSTKLSPPASPEASPPSSPELMAKAILDRNLVNILKKAATNKTLTASEVAQVQAKLGGTQDAPPAKASSVIAMAAIAGVSPKTFHRWRKRYKDFPRPNSDWSWPTASVLAFVQKHGLVVDDSEGEEDGAEVELEIRAIKREEARLDLAIKRREFAPVDELNEIVTALLGSMRTCVDSMPRALALRTNPKEPAHAEAQLRDWRDVTFLPTMQACIEKLRRKR